MSDTGHGYVVYMGLSFTIVKRLFAMDSRALSIINYCSAIAVYRELNSDFGGMSHMARVYRHNISCECR